MSLTSGPHNSNTEGVGEVLPLFFLKLPILWLEMGRKQLILYLPGVRATQPPLLCTLKLGGLANSSKTGFGATAFASLA